MARRKKKVEVKKIVPTETPLEEDVPKYDVNTGSSAKGFVPLVLKSTQTEPTIMFSAEADAIINTIQFSGRKEEVSWIMTSKLLEDDIIYINKVFIPKQVVSPCETEFEMSEFERMMGEWVSSGDIEGEVINTWFHLHPNNLSTNPSATDEDQMSFFAEEYPTAEFWVRGIVDSKGNRKLDVYYPSKGYAFANVDWCIDCSEHQEAIDRVMGDIRERTTKYVAPVKTYTGSAYAPPAAGGAVPALNSYGIPQLPKSYPEPSVDCFNRYNFEVMGQLGDVVYITNVANNLEYEVRMDTLGELRVMRNKHPVNFPPMAQGILVEAYNEYMDDMDPDDSLLVGMI